MAVLDLRNALERAYRLGYNDGHTDKGPVEGTAQAAADWARHRDCLGEIQTERIIKEMRLDFT